MNPATTELRAIRLAREQSARDVWNANPQVREAASLFGMSEDEYVWRYVQANYPPITYTARGANDPLPEPET